MALLNIKYNEKNIIGTILLKFIRKKYPRRFLDLSL